MNRPRVYISATASDNVMAMTFAAHLATYGIDPLRSPADDDSLDLSPVQAQMIASCPWFLVLQSPTAAASQTVRAEMAEAARLGSAGRGGIIALLVAPGGALPLPAGVPMRTQVVDALSQPLAQSAQQCATIILSRAAPVPVPTHPAQGATEVARGGIARRDLLLGTGIIAAGLAVAGGAWALLHAPRAAPISTTSQTTGLGTHAPGSRALTLAGHTQKVDSVAWSPDGMRIATASADATARIWSTADGIATLTYTGHGQSVSTVDWARDSRRVASASGDGTVQIWDATSGARGTTFTGHTRGVNAAAWSPDATRVASCDNGSLRLWQTSNGSQLAEVASAHGFSDCAWSPDGASVAASSFDTTVTLVDAASGAVRFTYTRHSDRVFSVAWSPDGQLIASGGQGGQVHVWRPNGDTVFVFTGHHDGVEGIAWSPDSRAVASGGGNGQGAGDTTVQVWGATTGTVVATYGGHPRFINSLAWSPDGTRIVSGSDDTTAQVWWAK